MQCLACCNEAARVATSTARYNAACGNAAERGATCCDTVQRIMLQRRRSTMNCLLACLFVFRDKVYAANGRTADALFHEISLLLPPYAARPPLRRDWAHPCHICAGTGLTPATSALGPDRPLSCDIMRCT